MFVDGRSQIVDMLSLLTSHEKKVLFEQIKKRHPQMAEELLGQSFPLRTLLELTPKALKEVVSHIDPSLFGLALKSLSQREQKLLLSRCPSSYASKAYGTMQLSFKDERRKIKKACDRVKSVMHSLAKRHSFE